MSIADQICLRRDLYQRARDTQRDVTYAIDMLEEAPPTIVGTVTYISDARLSIMKLLAMLDDKQGAMLEAIALAERDYADDVDGDACRHPETRRQVAFHNSDGTPIERSVCIRCHAVVVDVMVDESGFETESGRVGV